MRLHAKPAKDKTAGLIRLGMGWMLMLSMALVPGNRALYAPDGAEALAADTPRQHKVIAYVQDMAGLSLREEDAPYLDQVNYAFALLKDGKAELVHIDICAPVMHGKNGEDGTIQGLFELARIPYVGCGVLGSAVCMDKAVANTIMDAAGVPHCKWASAIRAELEGDHKTLLDSIEQRLGYPIFVKPANAGSSVGITKATDRAVLEQAVVTALKEDDKVVFEEFIDGQEVECAAIGNPDDPATVSTTRPGEILAGAEFYTYDDKYKNGVSQTVIPAHLSEEKLDEVRTEARRAYLALGCAGLSRCDFFVERGTGRVLCNELNTLPGFTSISMYPKLMEHEGLSYAQLVDRLLQLALHRRKGAY